MLRKTVIALFLLFSAMAIADSALDLYPLELGLWWEYEDSTSEGFSERTTTIKAYEVLDGYDTYYLIDTYEGVDPDTTVTQTRDGAVYSFMDMSDMGYEGMISVLALPAEVNIGDTWQSIEVDTVMDLGSGMMADIYMLGITTAIGYEDVGSYTHCMRLAVEMTIVFDVAGMFSDSTTFIANEQWLKSGIGPVKVYTFNYDPMGEGDEEMSYIVDYGTSSVTEKNVRPEILSVSSFPNPFNGAVELITSPSAEITIFDINGKETATITADIGGRGLWTPSSELGSGVYFVRVNSATTSVTKSLIYLK